VFETIDVPDSPGTTVTGISTHALVGTYGASDYYALQGSILDKGELTTITFPNAIYRIDSVNPQGQFVGGFLEEGYDITG